ncbi:MAG TPA: ATP-binding protein [Chthoniobacteraceae bacterium]|nr:ATP-binding protein [Chthoniobacteraceae bacterium]
MKTIPRALEKQIAETLPAFPAVYINGPRQAGKTTLVRELLVRNDGARFITFDDALERAAAMRNPYNYLKESGVPLILDEVQMVPELFRPLKKLVDEQRQAALSGGGPANGNYLLTGSANLLAIPELANAMVGRMATLTLLPLSVAEARGQTSSFLERCFARDFSDIKPDGTRLVDAMAEATYPGLREMPEKTIPTWFRNYVQKITLDDPRHLYNLEKAESMPVLLQALAARAGNLVNDAELGREVGLNAVTTRHYRGLLNNTFVTHTLKPWHRNITKRLVKSHKLYFHDTLLLCHLLGSPPQELSHSQPARFGHILENFVLSELTKTNHATGENADLSFYRTSDGREVDFVLERGGRLVAIEVKNAETITDKDLAGIKELQQVTGQDFHCGVVLCNTPRAIAYDRDLYLLPFSALWTAL